MSRGGANSAPATPCISHRFPIFLDFEVSWWRNAEQVLDEIVPPSPSQIQSMLATLAVKHVGHEQHIEVLIRLHQRIHETNRLNWMHIVIDVSMLQQQMSLQPSRHGHIRLRGIVILHRISLVSLIPPGLIQPRVVIARGRDSNLIELGEDQHGVSCAIRSRSEEHTSEL